MKSRSQTSSADIDFVATGRKTKQLIHLKNVTFGFGETPLLEKRRTSTITSGMRVGLVGANGSGKTTRLQLLRGEQQAWKGETQRAEGLRIVYFDISAANGTST